MIQLTGLLSRFLELLRKYQTIEMKHRDRTRRRIERQYRIVKPDASAEELREVIQGGENVQVFAQAVS